MNDTDRYWLWLAALVGVVALVLTGIACEDAKECGWLKPGVYHVQAHLTQGNDWCPENQSFTANHDARGIQLPASYEEDGYRCTNEILHEEAISCSASAKTTCPGMVLDYILAFPTPTSAVGMVKVTYPDIGVCNYQVRYDAPAF